MSSRLTAKVLYNTFNILQSKVARLSKYQIRVGNLQTTYLSNTKIFNADKPVLVLLHGFSGDKYVWNRVAKYFSRDYQLIIPDLKGHGETPYFPKDNFSIPSQCTFLLSLLDQLGVYKFSVIGNSMGGMMAAKLIESEPHRIHKCVLIDPAGARSQFIEQEVEKNENPFDHCTEQSFYDFFSLMMAKPPYIPKFVLKVLAREYIAKSQQHGSMFAQFYTLEDFFPASYRFEFHRTMLIWGLNDKLLSVEDYQQWKLMLAGGSRIYEDLGHMPMLEDPKRVAIDIVAFLQDDHTFSDKKEIDTVAPIS